MKHTTLRLALDETLAFKQTHISFLRFANRDIFMYHRGGGVGHSIQRSALVEAAANLVAPDLFQRAGFQPSPDVPSDVAELPVIPEEEEEEEREIRALLPLNEKNVEEEMGADPGGGNGPRL